jgi:hypothetical protein
MQKNKWQKHWDTEGSITLEGFQECARKLQRMLDTRLANARAESSKGSLSVTPGSGNTIPDGLKKTVAPAATPPPGRCRRWDAMRGRAHHRGGAQFT